MNGLRKVLREIHRRSLWQVLGVYLAGSWGVLQVVDYMTGFAGLPEWTPSFAFILLLIGLPIVTATAFVQEGIPGLRGDYRDEVDPNVLEGRTPAEVHEDPEAHPLHQERLLTWRNAILGGVGAGTLLVASVIAYFGMWAAGVGPMGNLVAQGVIAKGDAVILADFADATGEGLGEVVTQALRVDLSQAEVLRVVEQAELRDVLARMQRSQDTPMTSDVAQDAAVREGVKAVLDGEVAAAGSGYLITATLREAQSGRTLASFRSAAESSDDVIKAIDRLSQDIREKSGESLRNIRAGEPLEEVTTASLEALRLYVEADRAWDQGDQPRALELLNQAVELDPEFAMAWRRMAALYNNTGLDPERLVEATTQAYEHRLRLTERERYLAEAFYYSTIPQDRAKTMAAYQNVLRVAPDERSALNNLANEYQDIQDLERAGELYRRAVDGPGRSTTAFQNLFRNRMGMGRLDEAAEVLKEYEAAYPEDVTLWEWRFWSAFVLGDMDAASGFARPVATDPAQPAYVRANALDHLGQVAYWEGRLDEGRRYFLEAERAGAGAAPVLAWVRRLWTGYSELRVGDPAWALEHVRSGMRDGTFDALAQPERNHWFTGLNLAYGGDLQDLNRVLADMEDALSKGAMGLADRLDMERLRIMGRAAAGEKDGIQEALAANDAEFGCAVEVCQDVIRAWAAEKVGDTSEAIRLHELIRQSGYAFPELNGPHRLHSTLRLGPLYEEAGDLAKAIEAYQRLVDQWSGADARGRRVVDQAQARIAALAPAGD
ncbi:MAG TPA: tetratricopeptide repeat protein [Longimicrobiales bacterium]|nr:tetratricopeptide repeat protein [Longimicrobiales bacterium]